MILCPWNHGHLSHYERSGKVKRIAVFNDLSGFGKCSLSVSLPIISACGIQCCPLPTAVFTKQTAFENYHYKDLTDEIPQYINDWTEEHFDGIYTGFFTDEKQMQLAEEFKKLVGVITDRDIVIKAVANNCDCKQSIEDYINKNIIKIDYNRELSDAIHLMKANKIKRIIVADGEHFIGVLSLSDIIKTNKKEVLEALKTIWKIDDKTRLKDAEIDEFYL